MMNPVPVDSSAVRPLGGPAAPAPRSDPQPALPPALRRPAALVTAASAAVATGLGVTYAGESAPSVVDSWLQPPGNPWVDEATTTAALLVDVLAERVPGVALALLAAALCLLLRRRRLAVLAVVGQGATGVAAIGLKPVLGRTIHDVHYSYPSGHTAALTALVMVLGLLLLDVVTSRHPGRARVATAIMVAAVVAAGAAMGWAQSFLGAHYPTDTIGGFCAAVAIMCTVAWLVDAIAPRLRRSRRPPC